MTCRKWLAKHLNDKQMKRQFHSNPNAHASAIYGLGLVGAAIYFISTATSFLAGIIGFLKALVWPVFFVYEAFKHFGK